jgi:hypothetical protein
MSLVLLFFCQPRFVYLSSINVMCQCISLGLPVSGSGFIANNRGAVAGVCVEDDAASLSAARDAAACHPMFHS